MKELSEKSAFVAGAGRGIGRACALELARRGARVLSVSRTESDLLPLLDLKNSLDDSGAVPGHDVLAADLGISSGMEKLLEKFNVWGYPDIIIANVNLNRPLARIDSDGFDFSAERVFESVEYLSRILPATLAKQKEKRFGRWVGVSSIIARRGGPGQTLYAVKKSVLETLFLNLALEYGRFGITANIVSPGLIDTEGVRKRHPEETLHKLQNMNLMGRMGTPEEAAHAAAFLASPGAAYITGVTIPVCGGADLNWFLNDLK